jgi:hypothetical protein
MATNRKMTEAISRGELPREAQGRQILFVTSGSPPLLPSGTVVWSHPSGLSIVEVHTQ